MALLKPWCETTSAERRERQWWTVGLLLLWFFGIGSCPIGEGSIAGMITLLVLAGCFVYLMIYALAQIVLGAGLMALRIVRGRRIDWGRRDLAAWMALIVALFLAINGMFTPVMGAEMEDGVESMSHE